MKINNVLILVCLCLIGLSLQIRRQEVVSEVVPLDKKPEPEKLRQPDVGEIWEDLFVQQRTTTCAEEINRQLIFDEVKRRQKEKDDLLQGNGQPVTLVSTDGGFSWLKKWGFGPVSYLFDYLDPVFRPEALKEFEAIFKDTMSEVPEDIPGYKDPFNYAARIKAAPPQQQPALLRDIEKMQKGYDPIIYKNSVNAVQIHQALKAFQWFKDPGVADPASDLIIKYDINHDGRLNPKEFILADILYNKPHFLNKKCNHCFTDIGKKLKALFTYLDCMETGYLTAEILWNNLPGLKRPVNTWNIFAYGNSETIRTSAVNDFILKNQGLKEAAVNQNEFIAGVLLGIWDRQVTENTILTDDVRTLKSLRWDINNMKDKAAYAYVVAVEEAKVEQELKQIQQQLEAAKAKRQEKDDMEKSMRK